MGIQNENYSFIFKTATYSHSRTSPQFEKDFLSSIDTNCNLFISNIFDVSALQSEKIDLDLCFVPAHETFTSKQLPFLCPVLNDELLQSSAIEHKIQKLKFIIEYCIYLGLKRVAINFNSKESKEIFSNLTQIQKYFRKGKLTLIVVTQIGGKNDISQEEIWQSFITFRRNLNAETNIELVIEIDANLPEKSIIKKWMGEHVIFLSIKQEAFIMNNKGYPVLSAAHEQVVKEFMRRHTHLILHHENLSSVQQKEPYFKYFGFILEKLVKSLTKRDLQAQSLIDYLQAPLQPYIDNLDGQVYDIFEFDQHKYNEYEIALINALNSFKEDKVIVCYYIGSGKGLILAKLMNACKNTGKKVKVYCIEKNPYPLQTLKRRIQRGKWTKIVQIVETDIKDYVMPEHPDIIFSELLGGFGDNQLSPQCIKWAEKNATKETRIIPEKYTSFIRPISCSILHKQLSKTERESYFTVNFGLSYSPFQSKSVWSFQHPIDKQDNLSRTASLQWKITENMLIHGFQGTFDCHLYEKAYFSIVPETLTKDFYSWFPLFFSFNEEEKVNAGESIIIQIQRRCTEQRIWYQWRYQIKSQESNIIKESKWLNETGLTGIVLSE